MIRSWFLRRRQRHQLFWRKRKYDNDILNFRPLMTKSEETWRFREKWFMHWKWVFSNACIFHTTAVKKLRIEIKSRFNRNIIRNLLKAGVNLITTIYRVIDQFAWKGQIVSLWTSLHLYTDLQGKSSSTSKVKIVHLISNVIITLICQKSPSELDILKSNDVAKLQSFQSNAIKWSSCFQIMRKYKAVVIFL